nr:hypothetical protein CFP56_21089 [Quercus suber]
MAKIVQANRELHCQRTASRVKDVLPCGESRVDARRRGDAGDGPACASRWVKMMLCRPKSRVWRVWRLRFEGGTREASVADVSDARPWLHTVPYCTVDRSGGQQEKGKEK